MISALIERGLLSFTVVQLPKYLATGSKEIHEGCGSPFEGINCPPKAPPYLLFSLLYSLILQVQMEIKS